MKLYISMYHYTRDLIHSRYPNIKGMDITQLREQFRYFKEKFNVVRMEEVIAAVKNEIILPPNALLLTFDDGYIDNYTYAFPLLEEFGFQGSFFIPGKTFSTHQLLDVNKIHYILATANIHDLVKDVFERMDHYRGIEYDYPSNDELFVTYAIANRFDSRETIFVKRVLQTVLPEELRNTICDDLFEKHVGISEEQLAYELYLTEEQISFMKKQGMFIGIHGFDHYWLGNLPEDKMQSDIDKALETMDKFIDKNMWVMNFPYGSYNNSVLKYIASKGAVLGLSTEVGIAKIGEGNNLTLPRFDCNDFPPKSEKYKEIITI